MLFRSASVNSSDESVSVFINNGNGNFAAAETYDAGSGPFSIVMKDVNGDTYPDLEIAVAFQDNVGVMINNGDGTFASMINFEI